MATQNGVVNFFDDLKGWGIVDVEDGRKAFIHYSNIEGQTGRRSLEDGQTVIFNLKESAKGFECLNLKVV